MRFMLGHAEDSFELVFVGRELDGSKNGMLFQLTVSPTELVLTEHKTGSTSTKFREPKKLAP